MIDSGLAAIYQARSMKTSIACLVLAAGLLAHGTAHAQNPRLDLAPGDVRLVQVELVPGDPAKVVVHFSKAKLAELQKLILANYGKPIAFVSRGQVIVEPVVESELLNKRRIITLRFPDFDSAAKVAAQLAAE